MKKCTAIVFGLVLLLFVIGCTKQATPTNSDKDSNKQKEVVAIEIQGLEKEGVTIALSDIYNMKSVEQEMSNISSSGEVGKLQIKGVKLNDILSLHNTKQSNYNGIRFYAQDGYSIEVPKEILNNKDIVLFYEAEGKPLEKKFQPLRVGINDERAMYWVGNLIGMELISSEEVSTNKIILLDTAINNLSQEDYTYYDAVDKAIKTQDLLDKYSKDDKADQIYIKSVDGLDKNESKEIFLTGYLKVTGEDQPLFLSPDLPKGMHVKDILYMVHGETAYVSMDQLFIKNANEMEQLGDITGLSIENIFDAVGVADNQKYVITSTSGETKEVDVAAKAVVYKDADKKYSVKIETQVCKDIISIEVK